ncbi:GGDEF domain-containing protein [Paucibacter sp. B51]|uniref:GGDEF domain-containing protein n=1 Tax=Paucibacter sp. B51 TaxID=2993315 RepID=UPI0022EC0999|nr:GGDEF domain-containing protein [Paucibacter sp. B51]
MDLRTLFLAQTALLVTIAVMLWLARGVADEANGLRCWTWGIAAEGLAYSLLAGAGHLPTWLSGGVANALGALSVALLFVAIRQFLGLRWRWPPLFLMGLAVTVVGTAFGGRYVGATIFNGFVYGLLQLLNAHVLWRHRHSAAPAAAAAPDGLSRVQSLVALAHLAMGLVLPARALFLALGAARPDYLDLHTGWQQPLFAFSFVYLVVCCLGFLLMCKMRAEQEVRELALTDGLTGLANRRALDEDMAQALSGAAQSGRSFAVLMIDIDHFKAFNDQHGHRAGDAALRQFAARLRMQLPAQGRAYRYGGEEFTVMLAAADATQALAQAEALRAVLATDLASPEPGVRSASIGVALWQPGDHADRLFGRADRALYRAKAGGRNRVELQA